MPTSSGCAPSSSSITTPSSAGMRGLDLEQPQHDRLVGAEQLPAGDAVDERVADLARGAGDGDVEGVCAMRAKLPGGSRPAEPTAIDASSSSSRASVSSAMRSAAPVLPAPWSGCARRTSRRNRRCTSSRSMASRRGGRAPPSPSAAPTGCPPTRRGRARRPPSSVPAPGRRRPDAREPLVAGAGPRGPRAARPGRATAASTNRNATVRPDGGSCDAAMIAPITCGAARAVAVELEDRPHRAPLDRRRSMMRWRERSRPWVSVCSR